MKRIPMTLTVHTNQIPFSEYGDISILGEPMNQPIMRCRYCGIQPEFSYSTKTGLFFIDHSCIADDSKNHYQAKTYESLMKEWNNKRGRNYDADKKRKN